MIPAAFQYHAPANLREALAILRRYPGEAKVLAGGHSLLPMMKLRLAQPAHLVDLGRIRDLAHIRERDGGLAIGPMTSYHMLESSSLVQQRVPVLSEAASVVADLQVRNKGTIGGSLAHADPAADLPAPVVALEAQIHTAGGGRARRIPADRFFVDVFTTGLRETEVITEIFIPPLPSRTGSSYQKFANKASHFAIVGVAAVVTLDNQGNCERVRIGITGASSKAVRARAAERYLTGKEPSEGNIEQAAEYSTLGIECLNDLHASGEYREHLTRVFTAKALAQAVQQASR
ncbi:MAG TPA: xanthine dehydrogenase family protein subunit M [Dehalococcoidia bacterium]|nr:xanthine dehydrogenase family protein subunit M [Dehalococcoidia bacterium]